MAAETNLSSFQCPNCTGGMQFDPASGSLKCGYCGAPGPVSRNVNQEIREIPYDNRENIPLAQLSGKTVELICRNCGAAVQFEPSAMSAQCAFCAASIVSQPKSADPSIAPNGILPFKQTQKDAAFNVSGWLRGLWFAPNGLKKLATISGINGVYLPFWTFDAHASSDYTGARGDYYYVTETVVRRTRGGTVREQVQVRKTRWTDVSGHVNNSFDDVLVPASQAIEARYLSRLEPWDLEQAVPYEPGYLPGFKAQRYQVPLPAGLETAKGIMSHTIHYTARQDIGGDEQRIDRILTDWNGVTFKHLLLPVWIGAYRFSGRVYQVVVNARTGEVQGERPWSIAKLALLGALIGLVILILLWLSNS